MGSLLQACEAQEPELADHLRAWHAEAGHYQGELAMLLNQERERAGHPLSILETGVRSGVSTDRILTVLDGQGGGTLVSVDPYAEPGLYRIQHPRWRLVPMLSQQFLRRLATIDPLPDLVLPVDVFLHDSDHEVWCQTFEYEVAWHLVRPGGLVMTDDSRWGPHGAWLSFLARHSLQEHEVAGNLRYAIKPVHERRATCGSEIAWAVTAATALADAALVAWELQKNGYR
jgi:predicted O-methyltransferase YrrM